MPPFPTVRLIGAPTDVGASLRGASLGPDALRVAGLTEALELMGLSVVDHGNLMGPRNPWQAPVNGYRHLSEVVAWNRLLASTVSMALSRAELPVLLGGDHCLAIGSIAAVAQHCHARGQHLRVIWLDAHADFNTAAITPSGNLHGMPLAVLCGHGPRDLTHLLGTSPVLNASWVRQIGVRSVDADEKRFVQQAGLDVFDMRHIDEQSMRHTMEQVLLGIDDNTHVHVSLDVDFLDPSIAPGVGTAVRGGPTYREAQLCMEMIADSGRMGSLDVVELNPAQDIRNQTAELVVDLIQSLFGKSTLMRDH